MFAIKVQRWVAAAIAVLIVLGPGRVANAQIEPPAFPSYRTIDEAYVDVLSTSVVYENTDVSIGPAGGGLSHSFSSIGGAIPPLQDGWIKGMVWSPVGTCQSDPEWGPTRQQVTHIEGSSCFSVSNGIYSNVSGDGSTLVSQGSNDFVLTTKSGIVIKMSSCFAGQVWAPAREIVYPDGKVVTISFEKSPQNYCRVHNVSNNLGWRLQYKYAPTAGVSTSWTDLRRVVGYNAAFLACGDSVSECSFVGRAWPQASHVYETSQAADVYTVTDSGGQQTRFTMIRYSNPPAPFRITSIKLPGSSTDTFSYRQCPVYTFDCTVYKWPQVGAPPDTYTVQNFVLSAVSDGNTWTYGMVTPNPYILIRNSTGPTGIIRTARSEPTYVQTHFTGPEGTFTFSGGAENRISMFMSPEGWTARYSYDARGNVTQTEFTPRTGSTDPIAYERAGYPETCPEPERRRCNKPLWVEDRNGNRTEFTYDAAHGGVLTSTGPAVNGVLRQVRYEYEQRCARYLDGGGVVVSAPTPVWLLVRERMCRTGSPAAAPATGCAIAGDEQVTEYDYGSNSGVNNLLLRGKVEDAAGLRLRTCYGYDEDGNRISETSPMAGLAVCS